MRVVIVGLVLGAAALGNVARADTPPGVCGLEEQYGTPQGQCPSMPWYDEEGEMHGGQAQGR